MGAVVSLGRYTLHAELASGGMASVHLGRLVGDAGFARTVAIKRLHPQFAKDPDFVAMFLDEARLAERIHHPNVVQTLDVVSEAGELFVVMDLVKGESLANLRRVLAAREERMPVPIAASVILGALAGLEAAHSARDPQGQPLHIVHRDVSPQNVMVGADGVARLLDFGVAKARARATSTREGHIKGKIAYMAPEQLAGEASPRSDVYAVGVILWELLTGRRLFAADNEIQLMALVQHGQIVAPSELRVEVPPVLDRICARALALDPDERWPSARAMAREIDREVEVASTMRVSEWMQDVVGPLLDARSKLVAEVESGVREVSRDVLEELARISAATTFEEAATRARGAVQSMAKAADQAVRGRARKMASSAARNVSTLASVLKVPATNPVLQAALAPLVGKSKSEAAPPSEKKIEEPTQPATPREDATRNERTPKP